MKSIAKSGIMKSFFSGTLIISALLVLIFHGSGNCAGAGEKTPLLYGFNSEKSGDGRVLKADLTIELLPDQGILKVNARLIFRKSDVKDGKLQVYLNKGLQVSSVTDADGSPLTFSANENGIDIELQADIEGDPIPITIEYQGSPLSRGTAYVGPEGSYASWLDFWYPNLMGIDGLSGTNRFIVPRDLVVASNGTLQKHSTIDGKEEYLFEVGKPLFYSFAAASYNCISKSIEGIEFKTYFLNSTAEKADYYISKVVPIISFYKDLFGVYPYDNLSLVELPPGGPYSHGGSSEQGFVFLPKSSLPDNYFNLPVVAHELGHLYWGNWVIGQEFVMSEGMAQLSYLLFMESEYGEDIMRKYLRFGSRDHFISVYLYLSVFSRSDKKELSLDASEFSLDHHITMTAKGPAVLLMLRDKIGKEAFIQGLRSAIAEHAHTRMPFALLFEAWEKASGKDLDSFYEQWRKPGVPHLTNSWSSDLSGSHYLVNGSVVQSGSTFNNFDLDIQVMTGSGPSVHSITLQDSENKYHFTIDSQPLSVTLDPKLKSIFWSEQGGTLGRLSEAFDVFFSDSEPTKMADLIEERLREVPDDVVAMAWLAFFYHEDIKNDEKAISCLRRVLDTADPNGPFEIYYSRACFLLGQLYDLQGQRDEAVECYKRTLEVDRTHRFETLAEEYLRHSYQKPGK